MKVSKLCLNLDNIRSWIPLFFRLEAYGRNSDFKGSMQLEALHEITGFRQEETFWKPFGNLTETEVSLRFPDSFQGVSAVAETWFVMFSARFPHSFQEWFPWSFRKFLIVSVNGFSSWFPNGFHTSISVSATGFHRFPYYLACFKQAVSQLFTIRILFTTSWCYIITCLRYLVFTSFKQSLK